MSTEYAGMKTGVAVDAPEEEQIAALIDSLSSYIEYYHGGAVKYIAYEDGQLKVALSGACEGCNLAPVTLHGWIEGTVKQFFPDVKTVTAV